MAQVVNDAFTLLSDRSYEPKYPNRQSSHLTTEGEGHSAARARPDRWGH
jgi:hypothetical protein